MPLTNELKTDKYIDVKSKKKLKMRLSLREILILRNSKKRDNTIL